ncbi:hypothetical protein A2U01_0001793 [Trifolium medium]|uniref:Uncharacterized protein n=1 Tax=Trifolium medium TaxID=97028 RepID=A0A392M173_9FABA|nr:hypothetical protein [Trifolium medium]
MARLTRALELDFRPSAYDCPRATLFMLNQTSSVSDYYKGFNDLANMVYGVNNEAFLDCFMSGLQADIRRDVIALSPASFPKAFALAKLFEEKYTVQPKPQFTPYIYKSPNTQNNYQTKISRNTNKPDPISPQNPQKIQLPPLLPTPNQNPMAIKNISPTEMQLRHDKGLCYFCDEIFSHTHCCPNRRLIKLQLTEEDEENLEHDPPEEFLTSPIYEKPNITFP